MLYGSAKIQLNDLTDTQCSDLRQLAELSRALYNCCTRQIIQHYEDTGRVLAYRELKPLVCTPPEYKAIGGFYFQILLTAIADFKKYISTDSYALRKSDDTLVVKNLDNFVPPHPKGGLRPIEIKSPPREGEYLILPATRQTAAVRLRLPACYQDRNICRIIVRPLHHVRYWEMTIEYTVQETAHADLDHSKALGIDLGVGNLATCVTTEGDSFILDGRRLKCICQGYAKYQAKLRRANHGSTDSRRLCSLYNRTKHRSLDYIRKSAAYIVGYCIQHRIGTVVLGWGVHFQHADLGMNNQLFSLFGFAQLKRCLTWQCSKHGIDLKVVDESYTSQASALDLDPIPDYVANTRYAFSGKRIKRGLYMSGDGITINADLNGAINILRKGSFTPRFLREEGRGIASPRRIDPLVCSAK